MERKVKGLIAAFMLLCAAPATASELTCGVKAGDQLPTDPDKVVRLLMKKGCGGVISVSRDYVGEREIAMFVTVEDGPDMTVKNGIVTEILLPGLLFDVDGDRKNWEKSVRKELGLRSNDGVKGGQRYEVRPEEWTVRITKVEK